MEKQKIRILVLNGPNLNLLGIREPTIYGDQSYDHLIEVIRKTAEEEGVRVECRQSNHEGILVDQIQAAMGRFDGIILNPAAYTHTSIALLDALKAVGIPTVEVHLSDVSLREDFRQISYVRQACIHTIMGRGFEGYCEAIRYLKSFLIDHPTH